MEALVTAADVGKRLGRSLTSAETETANLVIDGVTGLILGAAGKSQDWLGDLEADASCVPTMRLLCLEKVVGAITNPNNLAAESEELGDYSHSQTFPREGDIGVFLSAVEERRVRRAVYGRRATSQPAKSILDRIYPDEPIIGS